MRPAVNIYKALLLLCLVTGSRAVDPEGRQAFACCTDPVTTPCPCSSLHMHSPFLSERMPTPVSLHQRIARPRGASKGPDLSKVLLQIRMMWPSSRLCCAGQMPLTPCSPAARWYAERSSQTGAAGSTISPPAQKASSRTMLLQSQSMHASHAEVHMHSGAYALAL